MPCVVSEKYCQVPHGPPILSHKCANCKLWIHAICGMRGPSPNDSEYGSHWCFDCFEAKMPAAADVAAARIVAAGMAIEAGGGSKGTTSSPPLPPQLKHPHLTATADPPRTRALVDKKKKAATRKPREKQKNRLEIPIAATIEDPFLNRAVAFYTTHTIVQ
eukprot:CAMPEP_0202448172 /NCGR_PEP_ID=MMETSP1360-20130828/6984_1 /ASSEMBLY_ACC=CAM_ASM_000848 /TAXON_ID=515479 /ORGANISM="Licmophora paradoxa, Strain CCMP2313" /LENGTH=160 /DNA_ID=CAMNT_0049065617 /DNA_START=270 /DNA_END=749 /DNA_ORIENTATION=+